MIPAVVVTYKKPEALRACLASMLDQCHDIQVIDNSPPKENLLYTKAINKGITELMWPRFRDDVAPKYILVCCDDVILKEGCVSALTSFMDANPECGIAMPLQLSATGDVTCGGCMAAFPYGRHINEPLTHPLYEKPYQSYWANGACFLVRTETLRECGLLDETMLFICSDSDYSFTIRARGWSIFVVPDARVIHEADGALHHKNNFIELVKVQDALRFAKKWLTGGLYQELSHEGASLKGQDVAAQVAVLHQAIAHYSRLCEAEK